MQEKALNMAGEKASQTRRRSGALARHLVFACMMSGLMSVLMSGIITFINTGLTPGFGGRWLQAFIVAWVVAFPLVSVIAPFARRMTDQLMDRILE